jgi:hypothetical protein
LVRGLSPAKTRGAFEGGAGGVGEVSGDAAEGGEEGDRGGGGDLGEGADWDANEDYGCEAGRPFSAASDGLQEVVAGGVHGAGLYRASGAAGGRRRASCEAAGSDLPRSPRIRPARRVARGPTGKIAPLLSAAE